MTSGQSISVLQQMGAWTLDHEREWLASRLAEKHSTSDKEALVRGYLTGLTKRYWSFYGWEIPMPLMERDEMTTYCLRRLYELEVSSEE